jgi:hypothetical protein
MSYALPESAKKRAEEMCRDTNLEVLDPGTMLRTDDGRWLVAVRDRVTGMGLWIDATDPRTATG